MSEQSKALELRKSHALINYQGRAVTITFDDVKRHLCPKATDEEIVVFLNVAQSLNLNPWAREIYLIKYSEGEAASVVVAEESYLKAAESSDNYEGHEAGIIVKRADDIIEREGALIFEGDELVGGWAKVFREDRKHPFYISVSFKECVKYTKERKPTRFWDSMPATMTRKVALARALREAFPSRLGGVLVEGEWEDVTDRGTPKPFERNGKPNWELFYAKLHDEFGITAKQAHELLGVEHFGQLLEKDWTVERIWDSVVKAIQEKKPIDAISGEVKEDRSYEEIFEGEKRSRDPETIKDMPGLLRACFDDFKLQPADVCKELGYKSAQDITEKPSDCYRKIAEVRGAKWQKPANSAT